MSERVRHRLPYRCIGVEEAERLLQARDPLILDSRSAEAFRRDHVPGARQISISNLSEVINLTAKNRAILIYCYHGHASREYAQVFSDFGFSEVYSLDGGYEAWVHRPGAAESGTMLQAAGLGHK